jgi:hypothetical protein
VHSDVGGGYADDPTTGTALSDITLSWIAGKAADLGLEFHPDFSAMYPSPSDKKNSLDSKHESWNPLWLFPKSRTIARDATLANSVTIRCENDATYRPTNLTLVGGGPGPGYAAETVVA